MSVRIRKSILLFGLRNVSIGKNFHCGRGCSISPKNRVSIGDDFWMGRYCQLAADADIGNDVLLASFVAFVGGDHKIDNIEGPIHLSGRDELKKIVIENDVWIGHGAIIMHGVRIGSGAVVAAGSVVTKDVEPRTVVGGNPARMIRKRVMTS